MSGTCRLWPERCPAYDKSAFSLFGRGAQAMSPTSLQESEGHRIDESLQPLQELRIRWSAEFRIQRERRSLGGCDGMAQTSQCGALEAETRRIPAARFCR
jgi:hypothetical protein